MTTAATLGLDIESTPAQFLYVSLRYFGNEYTGKIEKVFRNSVVVSFRLRSGRMLERRLEIVPSANAKRHHSSRCHETMLTWKSADRVVKEGLGTFASFEALLSAPGGYRPTIMQDGLLALLANKYDAVQALRKDARRAGHRPLHGHARRNGGRHGGDRGQLRPGLAQPAGRQLARAQLRRWPHEQPGGHHVPGSHCELGPHRGHGGLLRHGAVDVRRARGQQDGQQRGRRAVVPHRHAGLHLRVSWSSSSCCWPEQLEHRAALLEELAWRM